MKSKLIFLALIIGFLAGCSTPARVNEMTISSKDASRYDGNTPLRNSISVKGVSGGESTNPLWTSKIGNNEFKQALTNSLQAAKLLSNKPDARYALTTRLINVKQPLFGASLTVTSLVQYTLTRITDNKELLNVNISEPYTARFGDALIASERLKLANEGSAKNNIIKLIGKLYQLNINPHEVSLAH